MKIFNRVLSILFAIASVVCGFFCLFVGGTDEETIVATWQQIAAAFGVPGFISVLFAYCGSVEDVYKIKDLIKKD